MLNILTVWGHVDRIPMCHGFWVLCSHPALNSPTNQTCWLGSWCMAAPDSCLPGNWENSALIMLPQHWPPSSTQPPPTVLVHSVVSILHIPLPTHPSPLPGKRSGAIPPLYPPSSPPLLPTAPPYLFMPQPTSWFPSTHWLNTPTPKFSPVSSQTRSHQTPALLCPL